MIANLYDPRTLDDLKVIGTVKILKPRFTRGDGHESVGTLTYRVQCSKDTPPWLAYAAIYNMFYYTYTRDCHHEYDCCGCQHCTVDITFLRQRHAKVKVTLFRNV